MNCVLPGTLSLLVLTAITFGENPIPVDSPAAGPRPITLDTSGTDNMVRKYWEITDRKPAPKSTSAQIDEFHRKQNEDIKALANTFIGKQAIAALTVSDVQGKDNTFIVKENDPSRSSDTWKKALEEEKIKRERAGLKITNHDKFIIEWADYATMVCRAHVLCDLVIHTANPHVLNLKKGDSYRAVGTITAIIWPEIHGNPSAPYYAFTITLTEGALASDTSVASPQIATTSSTPPPTTVVTPVIVPSASDQVPQAKVPDADAGGAPIDAGVVRQVVIPATAGIGSTQISVGPLKKGQIMMFQYVKGEWTAWHGDLAGSPDDLVPKNANVLRVTICEKEGNSATRITDIPGGTASKPFEFKADHDIAELFLNMQDKKPKDNHGEVVYKFWRSN